MTEANTLGNRLLNELTDFLLSIPDELRMHFNEVVDQEVASAVEYERLTNLGIAAAAMLDAGAKPDHVIDSLQK